MAKISANGAKEIARWSKASSFGTSVAVLTEDPKGRTKLLTKWTTGASFTVATIPVGRKASNRPIYSDKPTLSQAEFWAKTQGYERVS